MNPYPKIRMLDELTQLQKIKADQKAYILSKDFNDLETPERVLFVNQHKITEDLIQSYNKLLAEKETSEPDYKELFLYLADRVSEMQIVSSFGGCDWIYNDNRDPKELIRQINMMKEAEIYDETQEPQ